MATDRIAFLAISQAHQYFHWLPAALRLAREPGVEVTVLGSSQEGLDFIRGYDPAGTLRLRRLITPRFSRASLFTAPSRFLVLLLNQHILRGYPLIVTTETSSGLNKWFPGFRSNLVLIKHGAGDREGSYNPKHALFDLILANGEKHRSELIARGLATADRCVVAGNAKMELVGPPTALFGNGKPVALYNPHFDRRLSSWFGHADRLVREMESITEWNFVVAPHVKLRGGANVSSDAANLLIDRGSRRSVDMTYTQAADVYIGDVSSQVYEYILRPRPCIFLNLNRMEWRGNPAFAHWNLGQVIEDPAELGPALARAQELQAVFAERQREMASYSIEPSPEPASERQARAILEFARSAAAREQRRD
jgi:hypothetical protein